MNYRARAFVSLALAVSAAGGAVFACSSSNDSSPGGTTGGDGGLLDGSASDATTNSDAEPTTAEGLFRALQPQLIATCGGTSGVCHVDGTYKSAPKWLGAPDPYTSAKAFPGIIPADNDPDDSKLLTQVEHEGPALSDTPTLYAAVKQWVSAEITGRPLLSTGLITIQDGANSIDLTSLAGGLGGVKLTFTATTHLGDAGDVNGGSATFIQMQISAPAPKGLHIVDPYFVIVPKGPVIDDPTNGFVGEAPLDVPAGQTVDFFDGDLVVRPYAAGDQVKLVFSSFDLTDLPDGGNTIPDCQSLTTFQSSAVPAFGQTYELVDGGSSTCLGCHGGGDNVAVNAMDLSTLTTDPGTACAQALLKLMPNDVEQSPLILTPMGLDGGDEFHPVRSAGADYHTAILGWATNEQ